jgi:HEAT repeat protein
MEEWNSVNDAVRGDAGERLNAVARSLGFDVAARRFVHSRQVGRRILGIRTLGHLRDPSSWQPLQEQLASQNALVSFYAAAALVSIDAQRAMPGIMNQLAERESWPGEAMARLLVDAGADVAREPIRALMLSLAPAKIPPLLPWLSHVDAVLGSEVAIELLRRHSDDVHIVAAALLVVVDPKVLPELARYAESQDADVRQSLAVAYGKLGALGDVEPVVRLMCDRVWWVRYRAGQALLALKGMTADRLEAIRAQLGDVYARNMLAHVRAEAVTR